MRTLSTFDADRTNNQDLRLDGRGNLAVVSEIEDVRQRVVQRLRWSLGEWFLRTGDGVPYRQRVFTTGTSVGLASAVITEHILGERGVTAVLDVSAEIDFETRRMSYSARVITDFGDFTIEEPVDG